jgi:hypothetical protein
MPLIRDCFVFKPLTIKACLKLQTGNKPVADGLADLREDQPAAFRFGNRVTELPRGFDPQADRFLGVREGKFLRCTVGAATGKFGTSATKTSSSALQ